MKTRNIIIAIAVIILVAILPAACLAQSGHTLSEARQYAIKFGHETKLGYKDSLPVYSAPMLDAVRGANGKASCHTSEGLDSAGWMGAWLMIRYEKNNGGYRVGWVPNTELKSGRVEASRSVNFAYWPVEIAVDCMLTDDPLLESENLGYVSAGSTLTFLATYQYRNGREYAYVSGYMNGQPVSGFIPLYAINW